MKHFYVITSVDDPGAEFETYQEARDYLMEWREAYPNEDDGEFPRIVGPGLNTCEAYDDSY